MRYREDYLKGSFTVVDEDGYKRTFQRYRDPMTEKLKKKSVSWKRHKLKSERQALKFLKGQIEKELFEQPLSDSIEIETFGELVDLWYRVWKPTVRETTAESQMKLLERFILSFYPRDMSLTVLNPLFIESIWGEILNLKGERSKKPLEKATLEKIRSLFKQIMYYGYRNELVSFDPQKAEMKIPRDRGIKAIERRKKKFLDHSEVKMLLECIEEKYDRNKAVNKMGHLYSDLVEFMIRNGLRINEVGALTIDKVDFGSNQLIISEGLVSAGRAVKDYKLNATKTAASTREIDLDDRSMEIIHNRIEANQARQEEMRKRRSGDLIRSYIRSDNGKTYEQTVHASKSFCETDYLFQTQNGNPGVYHSFNEFMNGHGNNSTPVKCVNDILKEKYLLFKKHITTHTFRYTHISLLAESGLPIKAIMERVGHSDIKTTLQIYNQVTKTSHEQVLKEISTWQFV
ncbi:site-specific integrase [Enterococcus sp. BWT-B8]|uniref:tyrosine-type recombinase/integrase n=1 Tax=Enterococcus sp. BWT-B8 TaxID=2885157 RepID=UPI001E4D0396|nr:site-specific integrase [Enterococcus sp. BWT-B8]MCB5951064.1 site-specific integrase [Enterococcus sp. BWT-B8]